MLIPLGHEQTSVRRLPWVTFAIMGLCVVIFVLMAPSEHQSDMVSFLRLQQCLSYYTMHPYLEMEPRFHTVFVNQVGEDQARLFAEHMRQSGPGPPKNPARLQYQQDRFDWLIEAYFREMDTSLLGRFGLVPSRFNASHLVTYQFLHVDGLHLIFNLLMLFVVGPFVEDVWGRPIFAAFYLAAGAAAGVMFAVRYPDLQLPLVGASGAIAGVMGAFLVRYFRSKIRFFVWLGVPVGPFGAPAWIIFPLWFAIQLFSAQSLERQLPEGGGVAFWAHVWGFAFGVVFAAAMAQLRIEQRFVNHAIEAKVTMLDNTAVDQAVDRARAGDSVGAIAELEAVIAEDPSNVDAIVALWNLSTAAGQASRATPLMVEVIESAVRGGDTQFAMNHWENLLDLDAQELDVDPLLAVRIAEILEADRRFEPSHRTLELAHARTSDDTPIAVVLKIARLALMMDLPEALDMVDAALARTDIPSDARPELDVARWALAGRRAGIDDEAETVPPPPRYLQVTVAVPIAVNNRMLSVDVRGMHRQVVFSTVKAISVAGIAREGRRPVAVVDLLLDPPTSDVLDPRSVRLFGDSFDPRTLVGGEDPRRAFRDFLKLIIESSGAEELPDPDAARANPFRSYPSLEAYELDILGVIS
jgi:membrane associated rhomboid family serine protease